MERLSRHAAATVKRRVDVVWRCGRQMMGCCVACGKRATAGLGGGCRQAGGRQAGRSARTQTKTHTNTNTNIPSK
jgi:hypothetical protein